MKMMIGNWKWRKMAEKAFCGEQEMSAQNEIAKWKKEVIKWQDTDTENQEVIEAKDAEIKRLVDENKRLKQGFGDITGILLRDKDS